MLIEKDPYSVMKIDDVGSKLCLKEMQFSASLMSSKATSPFYAYLKVSDNLINYSKLKLMKLKGQK